MTSSSRQKNFFDLFPAPEFLLLSTVGISITDEDIKFVQLRRQIFEDGFKLVHSSKIINPEEAIKSGLINDPSKIVSILKELSLHYGIRYARASLPEEKAYLFTTTIGWVPHEGLKDAVAFIIEENVPVTLAESVFDFEVIREDKNADEIKLTVSVLPKNVVQSYIELFESAGIVPVSFDTESQAIARALVHRGDKRSHLIVNLSIENTGFYIVEEEVVQFSTTPAYGFGKDDLYPNLNDLKAEMRKVLAFWNAHTDPSSERKIEKVFLCGPGAGKEDFVRKLMDGSDVRYVIGDVWLNTSPSRSHIPKITFDESLDYASAIGLVLPRRK